MSNPNIELAARRARMDMAVAAPAANDASKLVDVQAAVVPDVKSFRGSYLLYRQRGEGLERMKGSTPPRFRHPTRESAETEAARLLGIYPQSCFVILQEVGRAKLKAIDIDVATGCADDQAFADVPVSALRKAAQMPEIGND